MSDETQVILAVIQDVYPSDLRAVGPRAQDTVEAAILGEQLEPPGPEFGRTNDIWPLVMHIFEVATFVKCVVDVVIAVRKDGREATKEDVEKETRARPQIYLPTQDQIARILASTRQRI